MARAPTKTMQIRKDTSDKSGVGVSVRLAQVSLHLSWLIKLNIWLKISTHSSIRLHGSVVVASFSGPFKCKLAF